MRELFWNSIVKILARLHCTNSLPIVCKSVSFAFNHVGFIFKGEIKCKSRKTKAPMDISPALSKYVGNMGYFFMPNTASFAALATRNFTTVFAGI
jgi:hypothetical protein